MFVLTVASDLNNPGLKKLEASLKKFGYEYHVLNAPFRFGGQSPHIYEWAKEQDPGLWFLYTDAYDTVAQRKYPDMMMPEDSKMKMLISVEKACFPHPDLAPKYPPAPAEWKYVNGGGWLTTAGYFRNLFETGCYAKEGQSNDQLWLHHEFLNNQDEILLDTQCKIFQSIAFEGSTDFTYGVRLMNNRLLTEAAFIHGNGRTDMSRIYNLPALHG